MVLERAGFTQSLQLIFRGILADLTTEMMRVFARAALRVATCLPWPLTLSSDGL